MMRKMLISGTTQGIGRELYLRFKDEYEVITVNRRTVPGNNYVCDLSDLGQVQKLCSMLRDQQFDVLINNAGGGRPVLIPELTPQMLEQCTNLNYHAPVMLMQAVLEGMKNRNYGRIVNISSIAAKSPREFIPHYGASKAAMEVFSKSMAVYYGNCGVTINCICPGGVDTEVSIQNRREMAALVQKQHDHFNQAMVTQNGLGRMVHAKEIADTVAFFLSDAAAAISGQTLNICGTKEVHS